MAWYLILYLLAFTGLGVGGLVDDWFSRRSLPVLVGMVFATAVGVVSVFAFALPSVRGMLWGWWWPMLAIAAFLEIQALRADLREPSVRRELTRKELAAIIFIVVVITVPAYVMGVAAMLL
jgi:hypothetical protein